MSMSADLRAAAERLISAVRDRNGTLIAVGVLVVTVMQWTAAERPVAPVGLGWAIISIGALIAATVLLASEGRPLAAGGLLLAVSPVALTAAVAGSGMGAYAVGTAVVAVAAAVAWPTMPDVRKALAWYAAGGTVIIGCAFWWRGSFDRRSAADPTAAEALRSSGESLRAATTALGDQGARLASGGLMLWSVLLGVVVGGAFLAGSGRRLWPVVSGVLVLVVGVWLIELRRGAVHPLGGIWAIAGPVAWAAGSIRVDRDASRRLCGVFAAGAAVLLVIAQWSLIEHSNGARWTLAVAIVGAGCMAAGATGIRPTSVNAASSVEAVV